jgi:hypothetical protein
MEQAEKAKEAERNEGGRKRRHEVIDVANEGWPDCHSGQGFYGDGRARARGGASRSFL